MSSGRTPIGEILLRHEYLRPRELERLVAEPDRKQRLVSMLILRAEIEIDDATLALSEQTGYPGALERHLEQRDASLVKGFPQALMKSLGVVPLIRTAAGALVVIARDPSPALADLLRSELATPIELAVVPAIFVDRLVQRLANGAPLAGPPSLPEVDRPPPSRHRKTISVLMSAPLEPEPPVSAPPRENSTALGMPVVRPPGPRTAPIEIPDSTGLSLDLEEDEPPPPITTTRPTQPLVEPPVTTTRPTQPIVPPLTVERQRPARPTRPIPGRELQPLLEEAEPTPPPQSIDGLSTTIITDQPATDDPPPTVSTRPTRPSLIIPTVLDDDEEERSKRPTSPPIRKTPNIIKRPPTPLPVAAAPVARVIVTEPEPEPDPAQAQIRPTYPKLEPPPPSVFDADTARPHTPAPRPTPPVSPPSPPPTPPRPPTSPVTPRAKTTTDNWDDFEDSKVGMAVPPPEVLDAMSSIGITPPPVPIAAPEVPRERPPTVEPVDRAPTVRAQTAEPDRKPMPPIPKPGANIVRDIEGALSRATADRLLMKHASTRWSALLLVTITNDRARGSRGHGPRLQAGVETIELAIASSSLLQAAHDPAAALPAGKDPLFDLLGSPQRPSSAPVVVDDLVVAVLAAGDALVDVADELRTLAGALAVAYRRFPPAR